MELKNGHWEIVFKTSDIAYPFSRDNVRLMNEEVAKKENEDIGHYEYDKEKLKKQRQKKESPAETIFRQLLTRILRKTDSRLSWGFKQEYYLIDLMKAPRNDGAFTDEEWEYMIRGARLDFLVYDTMSQNALLAIEINGGHHYKAVSRHKDELKKQILTKLGLPLVSFCTDSIEGCEEKELRKVLNEVYMSRNK